MLLQTFVQLKSKKDMGLVGLEIEGETDVVEASVKWLEAQDGVHVEPIEQNVIEG
jgi:hypothetical protein